LAATQPRNGKKVIAPSGNRTRGISMATRYFTTKPMALSEILPIIHIPIYTNECNLTTTQPKYFTAISLSDFPHQTPLNTQIRITQIDVLFAPHRHRPTNTKSKYIGYYIETPSPLSHISPSSSATRQTHYHLISCSHFLSLQAYNHRISGKCWEVLS
jgi:hypothetical protein